MRLRHVLTAILLLLASCGQAPISPDELPRGFSRPGSPFPYNSPGW